MLIFKHKNLVKSLPPILFLMTGCQNANINTSTLNHSSFDTLDHFSSFLQSLDFESLRQYQYEEKKTKVEAKQKETVLSKSTEVSRADKNESQEYSMIYQLSDENGTNRESYENHHHYYYRNDKTFFSLSRVNQKAPNEILHDFENGQNYSKQISEDSQALNSPKYISSKEADHILNGVLDSTQHLDSIMSYQSAYSIKNNSQVNRYSSRMDGDRYLIDINYYAQDISTSYRVKYWFDSNLHLVSYSNNSYAATDATKDWDKKKHQVKENYVLTETTSTFDFEAKKTIEVPSEKDAILSIFGPNALD